jgi:hypothetical protein
MSPDGDWNCSEKMLACELGAKPIVAAPTIAHTPAMIPIVPLNRGIGLLTALKKLTLIPHWLWVAVTALRLARPVDGRPACGAPVRLCGFRT